MTPGNGPDAIFFDVDGVLIDSMQVKAEAFAQTFGDLPEARDQVMAYHHANGGVTRSEKIAQLFAMLFQRRPSDEELRDRVEAYATAVLDGVIAAQEIPGARAALQAWSEKAELHAVSATPHDELLHIFRRRGITEFFTSINGWPPAKGLMVGSIISEREYHPTGCLMVGDSREDQKAAQANGIAFIHLCAEGTRALPDSAVVIADLTGFDAAVVSALASLEQ